MVPSKSHDRPSHVGFGVPEDRRRIAPDLGTPLSSWDSLVRTAAEVIRDEEFVRNWFHQPLPNLGGMSPAALIKAGRPGDVARYLKARKACLMG